jgi:hypothetical protein
MQVVEHLPSKPEAPKFKPKYQKKKKKSHVIQAGLELVDSSNPPTSTSQLLGIQAHATTSGYEMLSHFI